MALSSRVSDTVLLPRRKSLGLKKLPEGQPHLCFYTAAGTESSTPIITGRVGARVPLDSSTDNHRKNLQPVVTGLEAGVFPSTSWASGAEHGPDSNVKGGGHSLGRGRHGKPNCRIIRSLLAPFLPALLKCSGDSAPWLLPF